MKLTKTAVEAAAPEAKDRFIWDEKLSGFGLKVTPAGRRSYVVQYRARGSGQARRITLGVHGAPWTTERAREAAERLLLRARNGEDPAETARADRVAAESARVAEEVRRAAADEAAARVVTHRFETVLEEYIARYAKPKNRRWRDTQQHIACHALPVWRDRSVDTITRRDVVELIDGLGARSPSSARLLWAHLRRMFGWCVERMYIDQSPCLGMRGPTHVASRDRWLTDDEVRLFWRGVEQVGGPFEPLFKLLLLTAQRREEVTGMRWSEVDLDRAEWVIPRERSKNDQAHAVDLAPAAVAILRALPRSHDLVFTTTGVTTLSGHSKARQRVADAMQALRDADRRDAGHAGTSPITAWRVHDLRRTAATGMAALGPPPHVVEAVLNHQSGVRGGLVAVYQHYQYRAERRAALLAWAEHVRTLTRTDVHLAAERVPSPAPPTAA
jgi:integrase